MADAKPYRVYTTAFDMEVSGEELLRNLREQRVFEAPHDEAEHLPVGEPIVPPPHFGKRPLITFLVDHSGSIKGAPAQWTISALRRAGQLLEASGVAFEVLGFTTVHWHGGKSKEKWIANWKPPFPGRLSDLLHIVYRDAEGVRWAWVDALSLMNMPSVLKENVDGEALIWAYRRARVFDPNFWLCIVVSDGAPVDDATLDANADWSAKDDPHPILCDHLREVIGKLDQAPNTQIVGFGIDLDVSDFYEERDFAETAKDDPGKLANFVRRLIESDAP